LFAAEVAATIGWFDRLRAREHAQEHAST